MRRSQTAATAEDETLLSERCPYTSETTPQDPTMLKKTLLIAGVICLLVGLLALANAVQKS